MNGEVGIFEVSEDGGKTFKVEAGFEVDESHCAAQEKDEDF